MRVLAKKLGMTQVYVQPEGEPLAIPVGVTVLQIPENIVVGYRTKERDGYNALIVGYFFKPPQKIKRAVLGFVKKQLGERELYPTKFYEVKTNDLDKFPIGEGLDVKVLEGKIGRAHV